MKMTADSPQMDDADDDNIIEDFELKEMSHEDLINQINNQILSKK